MIQALATKYPKHIAYFFFLVFFSSLSSYAHFYSSKNAMGLTVNSFRTEKNRMQVTKAVTNSEKLETKNSSQSSTRVWQGEGKKHILRSNKHYDIGGPTQPEMSSFKSVGVDNMVNLFTGDFSYNIPLLDVGGYPVNIFYDGSIGMEQEASWVGLGWNINPGTVSRNMRGVPDDFNGEEQLEQTQTMKPNITWGASIGYDLELIGIKDFKNFGGSAGVSLGMSFNNQLGPAFDFGLKGSTSFKVANQTASEKTSLAPGIGLGININSRSGLTLSPNFSLTASSFEKSKTLSTGIGLSTSYNSRSGIKQLQLSEQMSYNYQRAKKISENNSVALKSGSWGANLFSSTISFAKPSYSPSIRMPLTNEAWSGHFQLGDALFGVYGSAEVEVYKQVSKIDEKDKTQKKPLVGYLYYEKAKNNPSAVMDFTRLNDNEVTPNTTIISAPQYAYDVFSIQGEGTGGTIRAYRNDIGYVRDNETKSQDKSFSIGADVGIPGHFGANFNTIKTPSTISDWKNGNRLKVTADFGFKERDGLYENVYFRNPGETSVLNADQFTSIGGTDLVRYKLGGTNTSPTVEPRLERFSKDNVLRTASMPSITTGPQARAKRTQVINFLNAEEATQIGLDKDIKSYFTNSLLAPLDTLSYESIKRVEEYRKAHHISQINVTEGDGKRYVYGIPVYNTTQSDFTFTVESSGNDKDLVDVSQDDKTSIETKQYNVNSKKDSYLQITKTPAYAHSFLLSGLLSPDYVDVTGNGITEDDLGQAVKFNYSRMKAGTTWANHKWRTPITPGGSELVANFNAGNRSETKDDKGLITSGEREAWYLHSIESKTMIALFTLEERKDGKGVTDVMDVANVFGSRNDNDVSQRRLKKIDLYSKSDLKKNGTVGAKAIKTVWFTYTYSLCANAPGNNGQSELRNGTGVDVNDQKGKLTLASIYFTYNGKDRTNKSKYVFDYGNGSGNPAYQAAASDRWGSYKVGGTGGQNPGGLKNSIYPYATQVKTTADQNAGAWSLKKILLPSGGQIEVEYESDDYAYVQNRRAAAMMKIIGLGKSATQYSDKLYSINGLTLDEHDYVFVNVPTACVDKPDVFRKYLSGINQLAFKVGFQMPKGTEYIPVYATIADYGVYNSSTIWIQLNKVNNLSPLTLAALDYLRERLPGQAFPGYDVLESSGLARVGDILLGMLDGLKGAFQDPILYLRGEKKVQRIDVASSFVRLNVSNGYKYGGGQRVKKVLLKDNWKAMTAQYTSTYGQEYNYETTEIFNGVERTISSGVASYEPSIGGEENPFQSIVQVSDKVPLGPTSYGAIELPVLDGFFPAPVVGYSKVTVKAIQRGTINPALKKSRSGVGKQVTEFYTAKDFPVYYNHTALDPSTDKQEHQASLLAFFYKYAFDSRALSQGFLIETNDMHGKMKSQASYAEGDEKARINYTENFYRNTGSKGMGEKFDFIYASNGGKISDGNMGVDVELMTDVREFSVKSSSFEIQAQVDLFPVVLPFWLPFIWPVVGNSENTYRAVTTTKVVNYHSIVDSVVVIDKGSQVSTKNLVYDAETGAVIINRTNNEFDKAVYTTTYPAWWAYSGLGLAYKNVDAVFSGINFFDGKLINNPAALSMIESGDELLILDPGGPAGCAPEFVSPPTVKMIWALDKNKDNSSLTNTNPDFVFIDKNGNIYNRSSVKFRIVRSGKRNRLDASIAGFTALTDPRIKIGTDFFLGIDGDSKVISASAMELKEKWQTDNDIIRKVKLVQPASINLVVNGNFSNGTLGINSDYLPDQTQTYGGHEGYYAIYTNPVLWNTNGFAPCSGHTSGNDNMLLVNGAGQVKDAWRQTVNVDPNTNYVFSGWAQSVSNQSPANLQFKINNSQIGSNTFQLGSATCQWKKFMVLWNSGNNTTATLAIADLNTQPVGNDFALDDLSFSVDDCGVPLVEQEDCNGELEKRINPYQKGLLGNFKPDRNFVFYGARKEANPVEGTNIRKNGVLDAFSLYWTFNGSRLIPPAIPGNWVWNSRVTRVNAKGQELETKDALEIYTAAQYGYDKSIPIAITNNSASSESFYAGMEDAGFQESINNVVAPVCPIPHIDFSAVPNSRAHTGKAVVEVGSGSTLSKNIPVKTQTPQTYPLAFTAETKTSLYDRGGNLNINEFIPATANVTVSYIALAGGGNQFKVNGTSAQGYFRYSLQATQYIQISTRGLYDLELYYQQVSGPTSIPESHERLGGQFDIYDQAGQLINFAYSSQQGTTYDIEGAQRKTLELCPGIYRISFTGHAYHGIPQTTPSIQAEDWFTIQCTNASLTMYKTLSTQNGCVFTKPIFGTNDMLNPVFTVPMSKKMLFSAWVKETCGDPSNGVPCTKSTYTDNSVKFQFDAGTSADQVTLQPSGPIIEGWQRYEGYFKAPDGATTCTMSFINNTAQPIYFDDIRIHPFNANMKSYVYDPITLRLTAELDANNYATFYEYDEEGTLIRTKAETKEGIKTINETRSFKQRAITQLQ